MPASTTRIIMIIKIHKVYKSQKEKDVNVGRIQTSLKRNIVGMFFAFLRERETILHSIR